MEHSRDLFFLNKSGGMGKQFSTLSCVAVEGECGGPKYNVTCGLTCAVELPPEIETFVSCERVRML